MRFWSNKHSRFSLYLYMMLCIVALLGLSFFALAYQQRQYAEVLDQREVSIRLAEELRQSSNDLTRLARTYVITGNPAYKTQFQAVIDIRDGKRPRPLQYTLAYWDYKAYNPHQSMQALEPVGETVSLLELMRQAGITEAELGNLSASKATSDALVQIEQKAISLIVEDTPTDPEKKLQALSMLSDDRFLSMKAEVMRHIIETEQSITVRTQNSVDVAHQRLVAAFGALFVCGAALVVLIVKVRQQLNQIIGCSIPQLQETIARLGRGDFMTPINNPQGSSDSVMGWIAQTQRELARMDLAHFKAIVDSSDDAIISKSAKGIVASWNRGAEKIFGYTAGEIIGRPMQIMIPPERQHEEPDILDRIARGEKVDHFETQRLHRDGHLVDVSVTISPLYDPTGRVIGASKIARDISKAKTTEAIIQRLAFYDALTGLANRSLLQDRLQLTLTKAVRDHTPFAVLFLDLDNFKKLNDSHGHEAGDLLLKEAARRLTACVRESDTVARFGGDEFVILLNGQMGQASNPNEWILTVVQKIIAKVAEPYRMPNFTHSCTVSVGIAKFAGQSCTTGDLLKQADHAMYEAKRAGKNGYRFFRSGESSCS